MQLVRKYGPQFISCLVLAFCVNRLPAAELIEFNAKVLTVDANEGCDVGDIDGDGRPDVVAGRNWYRNGDWTPRPLRLIEDNQGYVNSNGDFLVDVNQDGRADVVSGSFFSESVYWYENPGDEGLQHGHLWQRRKLADTGLGSNEFSMMRDLDGDGRREWITNSWTDDHPMAVWRFAKGNADQPWRLIPHVLNESLVGVGQGHGMGFGDLNGDGREDLLVGTGWYERPARDIWSQPWEFHADWKLQLSCPAVVCDLNLDGRADIIRGNPHGFGLFLWLGRTGAGSGKLLFDEHLIDDEYSQLHALHFADLDGDGKDELVTGKRVRAHNGNDPGGDQPARLCYYRFGTDASSFKRFDIDVGHIGIGLQIRTADLNDDGKLDIVVAGKDGTQVLLQKDASDEPQ